MASLTRRFGCFLLLKRLDEILDFALHEWTQMRHVQSDSERIIVRLGIRGKVGIGRLKLREEIGGWDFEKAAQRQQGATARVFDLTIAELGKMSRDDRAVEGQADLSVRIFSAIGFAVSSE
jgi:hypothetical protein